MNHAIRRISRFFDLDNQGTDLRTEVLAGATSFLAAMYILVVNPVILQAAGMPFNGVLTSTVLISAFSSLAMGLYARNPLVMAPGMSINHMFAYAVVKSEGVPWPTALGCVFWAGVLFFLLSLADRKKRIASGIPPMLRYGMAGGIGLFIALIGFETSGFVVESEAAALARGEISLTTITFLAGLLFTGVLVVRKVPGSFILGILFTTVLAWPLGRWWGDASLLKPGLTTAVNWTGWLALPDFSLLLSLDILGALLLLAGLKGFSH